MSDREGMRRRRPGPSSTHEEVFDDVTRNVRLAAPTPSSRKEVIQPQVPLRLPCYDFTPVADPTVVGCLLDG